jgi:hypothetical protein
MMTKIATDFASKLAVAFVAVAMVFAAFAPAAQAQSSEDLQQMINDLLAQVAQLQGQTTPTTGGTMTCDSFLMDHGQGSEGAEVMRLQQFLNMDPDTRVAMAGSVGSAGMETMFYGPATAAAVSKFQVKYRAEILSPLGLVNPTGYFGAGTRAKANALCSETVVTTPDTDEEATDEDEEDMDEEDDFNLGGEASLDTFELDDGESTIEEGDEDVEIGEITVEFTNGDAEISRIDVTLQATGADAWDAFDTISLWVDGDKIAEVDASDEDDYLDEDFGELRFSNLNLVGMEDEEMTIVVGASVQNNLDNDELTDWDLGVTSMRFFDADGVAETVEDPANGDVSEFEIEEAGENEELNISLASSNPDTTDIIVDTDSDTDGVTIMIADIEAEDNDIELNRVVVRVDTSATTADVVDDIRVVIDGQSFDAESFDNTDGLDEGYSETNGNTSVWYLFDIDGDVVIDEDDEVEMEVVVDFNDTDEIPNLNYVNGTIISASVSGTELTYWDAEGADDLEHSAPNQFSGSANGEEHLLVAEGIILPLDGVETSTDTQGDNDQTGIFTIEFEVTAVEDDFYITDLVSASTSAVEGVAYKVDGPSGATSTTSGVLSSTADEDTDGVFTVQEGETETFTMTVTVDTNTTGQHRITLTEVNFSADEDGVSSPEVYVPTPAQDFRTSFRNINDN